MKFRVSSVSKREVRHPKVTRKRDEICGWQHIEVDTLDDLLAFINEFEDPFIIDRGGTLKLLDDRLD